MDKNIVLRVWESSRSTVEHFDKSLGDFRKIIFAIDAAFMPIAIQVRDNSAYLCMLGLALNVSNVLMWLVEKHYHSYLIAAAKVASSAEEELQLPPVLCLTKQLASMKLRMKLFRRKQKSFTHIYDWIYFIPAIIGLIPIVLTKNGTLILMVAGLLVGETILAVWKLFRQ